MSNAQANFPDVHYEQAEEYALRQAESLNRLELMEFFTSVHDQFYPEIDIKFMEYFLEIAKRGGEFVVHHSKLREYGVMTSENSAKVHEKLVSLRLVQDVHYRLADIRLPVAQGGYTKSKVYYLTPRTFKKCLMRAK